MKPTALTFALGSTNYKQPLILTYSRATGGGMEWSLRKEAACQRDDTCLISGIPEHVLLSIAAAVESARAVHRQS